MVLQELPTHVNDWESAIKASAENFVLHNSNLYSRIISSIRHRIQNVISRLKGMQWFWLNETCPIDFVTWIISTLPQQEPGILMGTLRFTILPYIPEDEISKPAMNKQVNDILQIVSTTVSSFTIFSGALWSFHLDFITCDLHWTSDSFFCPG